MARRVDSRRAFPAFQKRNSRSLSLQTATRRKFQNCLIKLLMYTCFRENGRRQQGHGEENRRGSHAIVVCRRVFKTAAQTVGLDGCSFALCAGGGPADLGILQYGLTDPNVLVHSFWHW